MARITEREYQQLIAKKRLLTERPLNNLEKMGLSRYCFGYKTDDFRFAQFGYKIIVLPATGEAYALDGDLTIEQVIAFHRRKI